ncbi:SGNH/GDSL hydrolase family protein [Rufibacter quisquiliarum]|uniref:Lysophospholipase L1-like esterase n=1 Tax=Rufibacter quisquiliarum TaxID=1549639 RepID=A0A839GJ77_9BACT|nr:SGNH/GDSL hydrolase family protein [Rufibacter quisquiliarum]MBA9078912.1 lysophospholipase L1-like esterase [Rufibacter quisquiliarum]
MNLKPVSHRFTGLLWGILITFFCGSVSPVLAQKPDNPTIWEKEIMAFEKSDSLKMPPPGGILFVGSSSVRGWRSVGQDFPDKPVLNRGFGGSRIGDAVYYFDRIIKKYQPRQIFFYAGDNDIASGKNADMTFEKFKAFAKKVRDELPKTELVYLSIKPSPARWSMYPESEKANKKIKRYAWWHRKVKFVDVSTPMLGPDGKPRPELYIGDGIHMTPAGYKLWVEIVKPYLAK